MKTNHLKLIILLIFSFFTGINLNAQPRVSVYTDLCQNVVSDGLFFKTAGLANYQFGKYNAEAGCQFDLKNSNQIDLSGFTVKFSRDLRIKNFPLELNGLYIVKPFSSIIRETNWGVLSNVERRHVRMGIGANFRTFACTRKAIRNYDIRSNTKVHEVWNLIYSFSYYLKPLDYPWNVALTVTDLDYFTIEHETNPVLNLHALCRLNSSLNFFAETRYRGNGPLNLNLNLLGFSLRAGITINIQ